MINLVCHHDQFGYAKKKSNPLSEAVPIYTLENKNSACQKKVNHIFSA